MSCPRCWYGLVRGDVYKVGWDGDVLSQFHWDNLVCGDAYKAGWDSDVLSQVLV
jgi:hypothetical protein